MMAFLAIAMESKCQHQNQESTENGEESIMKQINILQHKYGEGRIILKNRGIYKRIKIHQINDLWIVYIKNGSTHDMMVEEIDRIEIGKEKQAIIRFDERGKVIIHINR